MTFTWFYIEKDKKDKSMEDGSDQNRKKKVIYSKKDNSEFKVAVEKGESEMFMTGRDEEEQETRDQHVTETELIGDMKRPEGETVLKSIENDSQSTTDKKTDEEDEMTGRRMEAKGGKDEGEKMMESVFQLLPLSEKHKEELMSRKSSSMEWGIYFNLDQKAEREQEDQFVEERETESDVDIKQLNNKKKRSKKKKTQANPCSGFPPQKTKQPETDQQKEATQRTLQ